MRKIQRPFDAVEDRPICNNTPIGVEIKMRLLRDRPFLWFWRLWCRIFGHKIKSYVGGYKYTAYGNGIPYGKRKGREKRPIRIKKTKYLEEGYCAHCGKHFTNTYLKKRR